MTDSLAAESSLTSPTRSDFAVLAPWYAAECLCALANNLYITGAIFYARNTLGRSNADCLWISASWGLLYVFLSVFAGRVCDRWGPRTLAQRVTLGGVFTGLLGLTAVAIPNLWVLILGLAAFNVTNTPVWPAIESAITRTPARASLSRRIAIYNVMWSTGAAVAMTFSGVINNLDPRAIFLGVAAASLFAFLLIRFGVTVPPADHVAPEDDEERSEDQIAHTTRAKALLHMAWLVNPLSFVAIFVFIAVIPQVLASAGHLSPAIGGVWAFVRVPAFVLFSVWTAWHYRVRFLLAAYVLMAGSFLAMLRIPNPSVLLFGQVVFGISGAFLYASSLYYAMHVSAGGGGHAGIHEAMLGSGMFVGPFIGAIAATAGRESLIAISVTAVLVLGFAALCTLGVRANR